ncbi:hypothetical protein ABKA04_004984 [Annulohypoxylon sp. FPYF3050]
MFQIGKKSSRDRPVWESPDYPSTVVDSTGPDGTIFIYAVTTDGSALESWVSQSFSVASAANSAADIITTLRKSTQAVFIP